MATSNVFQPAVEWAQRKDIIYVTIGVENVKEPKDDLADDKFHFRGRGGPDEREFDCALEFYKPVDASKARRIPSDRSIQFVIPKKESGPFWPRLLKTDKKMHWVKIDFNKWKDEDELSEDDGGQKFDFNDMMGQMGGMGGGGMGGMGGGGMGGMGGMGAFDGKPDLDDLDDSDNEELPDLEDDKEEKEKEGEEGDATHSHTDEKTKGEGDGTKAPVS